MSVQLMKDRCSPKIGFMPGEFDGPRASFTSMAKVTGRLRRAPGNGGHNVLITDGHEAEAKAAARRKAPTRSGRLIARWLGIKRSLDPVAEPPHRPHPSHEHAVGDRRERA